MKSKAGFTLIELVVVILIMGILAAFSVPAYLKSVESGRADDATAVVNMIATTNRMFYLDHNKVYASGLLDSSDALCGASGTCATAPDNGALYKACNLVACKYLAAMDFSTKPYNFYAINGAASVSGCGGLTITAGLYLACAERRQSGTGSTSVSPYKNWGYTVSLLGGIDSVGGSPQAVQ